MPAADPIVCASAMLRDCEGYIEPNDIYPQVRVYRSVVAGSRLYVTEKFKTLRATSGWITFVPAGHPRPHPHNREALAYDYGEFCTSDANLAHHLDQVLKNRGSTSTFVAVQNPEPVE